MKSVSPGALRQVNRNFRRPVLSPEAATRIFRQGVAILPELEAAGDRVGVNEMLRLLTAVKRLSLVPAA